MNLHKRKVNRLVINQYSKVIENKLIKDEKENDLQMMIKLLANATYENQIFLMRITHRRLPNSKRDVAKLSRYSTNLAAKLLCLIFDPIKPPEYSKYTMKLRLHFRGIAESEQLQENFLRIMKKDVLSKKISPTKVLHEEIKNIMELTKRFPNF